MSGMLPAREKWRVALFTVEPLAVPRIEERLRARRHRLVGILTAPGPRSRRTDDFLKILRYARPGLDIISSNYPGRWADMIKAWRPDLIICGSFNWKIPADVLDIPPLGAINLHDALLPRNRGRNATGWALRTGIPHGYTVHYMTPEFDDGPILSQRPLEITDEDYSFQHIMPRLPEVIGGCWEEALDRIEAGDPGTPQDESQATYAGGAFEPEWREIDWSDSARHNFIKIRSWYGARDLPRGAFGDIDGERCLIKTARLAQPSSEAAPGTVLERRDDGSLLIHCGDGPLEILEWSDVDAAEGSA